jgi:hypothetical protein
MPLVINDATPRPCRHSLCVVFLCSVCLVPWRKLLHQETVLVFLFQLTFRDRNTTKRKEYRVLLGLDWLKSIHGSVLGNRMLCDVKRHRFLRMPVADAESFQGSRVSPEPCILPHQVAFSHWASFYCWAQHKWPHAVRGGFCFPRLMTPILFGNADRVGFPKCNHHESNNHRSPFLHCGSPPSKPHRRSMSSTVGAVPLLLYLSVPPLVPHQQRLI